MSIFDNVEKCDKAIERLQTRAKAGDRSSGINLKSVEKWRAKLTRDEIRARDRRSETDRWDKPER